ncbi:MAG: DUF3267 domain-containing protein [Clostridia bacterium]|nr:DUF3267 domain-containing protein [Clostridia bacterium]
MQKNHETELPAGYRAAFTIDAKNKKTGIILNLISIVVMLLIGGAAWLLIRPEDFFENYSLVRNLLFLAAMLAYVVLHELVHGAAYKLLTKRKLTFGLTLTVAFCGVPDVYVYRRASLIAVLAPFVVFTLVFGAAAFLLPNAWDKFYAALLLAVHVGGCTGDLWNTLLYLTRFRDPRTLTRDTGPLQSFYVPEA